MTTWTTNEQSPAPGALGSARDSLGDAWLIAKRCAEDPNVEEDLSKAEAELRERIAANRAKHGDGLGLYSLEAARIEKKLLSANAKAVSARAFHSAQSLIWGRYAAFALVGGALLLSVQLVHWMSASDSARAMAASLSVHDKPLVMAAPMALMLACGALAARFVNVGKALGTIAILACVALAGIVFGGKEAAQAVLSLECMAVVALLAAKFFISAVGSAKPGGGYLQGDTIYEPMDDSGRQFAALELPKSHRSRWNIMAAAFLVVAIAYPWIYAAISRA